MQYAFGIEEDIVALDLYMICGTSSINHMYKATKQSYESFSMM